LDRFTQRRDQLVEEASEIMSDRYILESLLRVEKFSRDENYAGYCKFDALNSPALESVVGHWAPGRLVATQIVNRIPLPLRKILGVKKTRNPKGIANFVKAYAHLAKKEKTYERALTELSDWLLENHSARHGIPIRKGMAWGYSFPWQSPGFFAPRYFPNCIVTSFCADALLSAFHVTSHDKYLLAAMEAGKYILECLPILEEDSKTLCIGYVEAPLKWKVININSVAAGFLAKLGKVSGEEKFKTSSHKMLRWVISAREAGKDYWNYTTPKEQSGIGPDNYHTGGILDGIFDFRTATGITEFDVDYWKCLRFYEENFFTDSGEPKWRVKRKYPLDIHGAAQGILTFTRASTLQSKYLASAERIAAWTIREMQDKKEGFFYYQKYPLFTWKLNLMRWNNSWMAWALAELLSRKGELG
jgi:hypothetical protein